MGLGLYIHFPFCLQQCSYCDFATALHKSEDQHNAYVDLVIQELESRSAAIPHKNISTIYFGGGTPSLMKASHILKLFRALEKLGFRQLENCEITIEINPDTVDQAKLQEFLDLGINRFSIGVQTFDDKLLKLVGRKHTAKQTRQNLELLARNEVNFSVDLLYALPHQTWSSFTDDLNELLSFSPKHFSPYLLTLPAKHTLQQNRPSDDLQVKMMDFIFDQLRKSGFIHYEISNFAQASYASKHNLNAWKGGEYWGVGMSAHSYLRRDSFGTRFYNPPTLQAYKKQIETISGPNFLERLPLNQIEQLKRHEAITDFSYTRLRLIEGLRWAEAESEFGRAIKDDLKRRLSQNKLCEFVEIDATGARLTKRGIQMSNHVFAEVAFLKEDLSRLDTH